MPRWVIPSVYVFVSLAAAVTLPRYEYMLLPQYSHTISVSTAQALLGSGASGMMALTAIVFSIVFLFIQYTSTAYSKRLVLVAGKTPVLYHAFGLFLATFTFALGTLAWVNRGGTDWVPFVSIVVVGILLFASIALLALLMYQISTLRITTMLRFISEHGRRAIRALPDRCETPDPRPAGDATQISLHIAKPAMVLTAFDADALTLLARRAKAIIELECAVGDMVFPGYGLARVYGARGTISEADIVRCLKFGPENTYDGDVRFSLRLLVDAAIMALSPAVNDPTTAVEVIDHIEDLVLRLGRRMLDSGCVTDADGVLRLLYPTPTWDDYLSLAFDEIRSYGRASIQVVRRMRTALIRLADGVALGARRDAVLEYLRRLDADVERGQFHDDLAIARGADPQGLGLTRDTGPS